jgi:hypothetical protein
MRIGFEGKIVATISSLAYDLSPRVTAEAPGRVPMGRIG